MASRCHWRFVVRDQNGRAIQNAAVYVYQPGTTTAFSGTAYTAYTGGTTTTNPFTSNSQGEVEAWFDTTQRVDVYVTDNGDTAYYAGTTSTISFTAFTEEDEIRPAIADVPTTVGTTGDMASIDIGDAVGAGSTGRYSDAGHQHAVTAAVAGDHVAAIVNPFTVQAAAVGSSGHAADAGHVHAYSALTPAAAIYLSGTGAAGSLTNPAREDHIHPFTGKGITGQVSISNTTTETALGYVPIAANQLAAGATFLIVADGYFTNGATARTCNINVRWGANATPSGGVAVATAVALTGTTTSRTDAPASIKAIVTFRTIGGSGTAVGMIEGWESFSTAAGTTKALMGSAINAAASVATNAQKDLILSFLWTAADATVTFKCNNFAAFQVA